MKNNSYAPKKTALRRLAAAALALALCLCALPVAVFAEDAPSRPQSEWIRAEEVAIYPQVEQWSSLFGRNILVPGPYAGAGLSVKLEGVDSECKYTGFTVEVSKKKQTPSPVTDSNRGTAIEGSAFTTGVLEPNQTYYVYVALYENVYGGGYSSWPIGVLWSDWSEPISVTMKPSTKVNPMTVKGREVKVSASKVKKKAQTIAASKAFTIKKAKGKVTCQVKKDLTEKASKYVKVAKNGKVTVKKGTKKGTYRLSVDITAKGDSTYAKTTKTAALTVTVK